MSWLVEKKTKSGKSSSWVYRYCDWFGKTRERSTGTKFLKIAKEKKKTWDACRELYGKFPEEMAEEQKKEASILEKKNIFQQIELFLDRKSIDVKKSTLTRYRQYFRPMIEYLTNQGISYPEELSTSIMDFYKITRLKAGKSRKTVWDELILFRSMVRKLVELEELEQDPVKKWPDIDKKIPKNPETIGNYSDFEIIQILEFIKSNYFEIYDATLVAAYTGMRIGEIKNLKFQNIDFKNCKATVFNQKSIRDRKSVNRTIPLHPKIIEVIKNRKVSALPSAYIFPEMRNRHSPWIRKRLKIACRELGIQYKRFHGFRHSFISKAANMGIPLPKIQYMVGHTNIETTQNYLKSDEMDQNEIKDFEY